MKHFNLLIFCLIILGAVNAQNRVERYYAATDHKAEICPNASRQEIRGPKAMWDIEFHFDANAGGQPGVETNGLHIYCPAWASDTISRYAMDGANATDFTIDGVSNIRDLAYDGTYFYGAAADMDLKVMDLENETLINSISATCSGVTGIRHIAFDPNLDNGNGGFWIGNWAELGAIDMNGNELVPSQSNQNCYGSAWDNSDPNNPVLWLFQLNGPEEVTFHEWDINTMSFTGYTHEASDVPGFISGSTAGGACTWDDPATGKKLLIGNIQQSPNLIFAYELSGGSQALSYDAELMNLNMPMNLLIAQETSISGKIKNKGTETISSFDVSYSIDGGFPVVSSISGTAIAQGETYDFTTEELISFDTEGDYEIIVTIKNINGNDDEDPSNNTLSHSVSVSENIEMWDVVWYFDANASGQPGIETDGTHIYCPFWEKDTIMRYNMDGSNATSFTISGASNLRDLAYDGTYFYGAAADLNLKVMDFDNEILINTIAVNCTGITGVRHIAFDPSLDNGNGGFWVGNWAELGAIDMQGNELVPNQGNESCYGSAYDNSDPANPTLWLFQQVGTEEVTFSQFDINTLSYTGVTHQAIDIPGFESGSLAGGACTWDDPVSGLKLLIGNIQQSPNLIFAYNISEAPAGPLADENFDNYTAGEMVACQNPEVWTTWSNSPCGDDDAYISTNQSFSAPNSVNIVPADDLVLELNEYKTSGIVDISLMIYIPSGGNAYYNIMASFQEPREWGFEIYFPAEGIATINAGEKEAATFNYNFDSWIESTLSINLDGDWAEYYVDGTLIHSWQWTLGASGGGCKLQFGALDFYGQEDSDYYFDNLIISEREGYPAPTNLTATVNQNEVELNWNAPENSSVYNLIGYKIFRGNEVIAENINETTYTDANLVPNTYNYNVRAIYEEGFSAGAGPVEAVVEGGTERDLVIVEVATGTWCGYCPGAAMGVDEMHENGLSVGIIEYHGDDAYETDETNARIDYYNVSGFPTALFGGENSVVGGSLDQSMFSSYLPEYEKRFLKPSLFEIEAYYYNIQGDEYQIQVNAEMIDQYPFLENNIVLQVALTESHIEESWQGMSELNFVCRDMIPTANGTSMNFADNALQSATLDFTIPDEYNSENIELIVFIQDNDTKEILQGSTTMLTTGISKTAGQNALTVYPNPAQDFINITTDQNFELLNIVNSLGQVVYSTNNSSQSLVLNTSNLKAGLYFIQLKTQNKTFSHRFVIN